MEDFRKIIKLRCVFCRSNEFALPWEGYTPPAGSFVVCANCGRENDITSLLVVAKATGFGVAKAYAERLIDDMTKRLRKSFGNNKFIKLK
ncbi:MULTISPECIES: hypothetical protein [Pseudomonas]|uniref:hypothetical protein n=1 Tax=Pseudomonas TaxID=286 RepID=UPI000C220965|nr:MULTISPECIES: hypothetical protein [Pseudomonas]PJH85542.1 hypothetical protein CVG87_29290 [Pseudomonas sp. WCS365]